MIAFRKNLGSTDLTQLLSKRRMFSRRGSVTLGMIACKVFWQSVAKTWAATAHAGVHWPRPFPAVWGQRIAYCNVSALLVVAMDIRGTLLASVPRVWSSPMCVWMRWAVTRAPKKACHEMSEKGSFWGQLLKVKAP
eukprot:COSAG01_NODE_129_length_24935_cov_39.324368_26_plen_136_part_00